MSLKYEMVDFEGLYGIKRTRKFLLWELKDWVNFYNFENYPHYLWFTTSDCFEVDKNMMRDQVEVFKVLHRLNTHKGG
jgi:hypothetical protein